MSQKSTNSSKALNAPMSKLENAQQEINRRLRASGRMVTEIEPSDSTEFEVTFPQSRVPGKKENQHLDKTREKYCISVNYGYDIHEVVVSKKIVDQIQRGEEFSIKGQGFYIEGRETQDVWNFNCEGENLLTVHAEDGHQIFIGKISQATISKK